MGLGITKTNHFTTWEIPLMGGVVPLENWQDNTWIIEHLRQLANKIESENPRIINIGLNIGCHHNAPNLYLEIIEINTEKIENT